MEMKTQHPEIGIFSDFLRRKGLSSTQQRQSVLKEVFRNHNHFEADDIVDALKKRNMRVSRATVYRTLAYLEECSLIRKVDLGHGHSHYEHTLGHEHHEHLYCGKCGEIIEFSDQILEERIDKIAKSKRFVITSHEVKIFGVCKKCHS